MQVPVSDPDLLVISGLVSSPTNPSAAAAAFLDTNNDGLAELMVVAPDGLAHDETVGRPVYQVSETADPQVRRQ